MFITLLDRVLKNIYYIDSPWRMAVPMRFSGKEEAFFKDQLSPRNSLRLEQINKTRKWWIDEYMGMWIDGWMATG